MQDEIKKQKLIKEELKIGNTLEDDFSSKLYREYLRTHFSSLTFVCIGTTKLKGDSFGPLLGQKLVNQFENYNKKIKIIGNMKQPVHYLNYKEIEQNIKRQNEKTCIIAIDSAFHEKAPIGKTFVNWGGIQIGKALQKKAFLEADINIKTIIGKNYEEMQVKRQLQKISDSTLEQLTKEVANTITNVVEQFSTYF